MSVLLGVILLFAVLTLVVAVMQAVAIIRLAPPSAQLAGFMPLGWFKFRELELRAGPDAAQPLNIYKRAVIAFLVFLALGLVLSGWTVSRSNGSTDTAFNPDLRRVATMPGALEILES